MASRSSSAKSKNKATSALASKVAAGKKKPQKVEKMAGAQRAHRTAKKRRRKRVVLSDKDENEDGEEDRDKDTSPPPEKAQEGGSKADGSKEKGDEGEDEDSGDGEEADEDGPMEIIDSDEELEQAHRCWQSPVYTFFKEDIVISYKKGRKLYVFRCVVKDCGVKVCCYLNTKDAVSSGNLFKHAHGCWKDEVVNHAMELGNVDLMPEKLVKPKAQSKSIMYFFNAKILGKQKYSHCPLLKIQTRVWAVRWVAEDLHLFKMVVPSPSTVSCDVKAVFIAFCKHLAKMLQTYASKLSFASDVWTSPNHPSFMAVMVHLEVKGHLLRMLLDLVELAKSHTGVNLAVMFHEVLQAFGIENKMVKHLAQILTSFEGKYHHTRCFAHVIQLVAHSFVSQFDVQQVQAEEVDVLVDDDVHALLELAKNMEEEEWEVKCARQHEDGVDEELEDELDHSAEDDNEEWLSEVASLSEDEHMDFEKKVWPVKMAMVKICKFSFKIINLSTKLLPTWHTITADLKLPNYLLPRDVRTHWNLTYNMILESIVFCLVINKMTDEEKEHSLGAFRLKKKEWKLLEQLCEVLKVFKHTIKFFSCDTPSLATVIPAMDYIDTMLTNQAHNENLDEAICAAVGMAKKILNKYYKLSDLSATYCSTMILHPQFKLQYFEDASWPKTWIANTHEMLEDEYTFHYKPETDGGEEAEEATDKILEPKPNECPRAQGANIFDHLPSIKSTCTIATAAADEVERYLSTAIVKVDNPLKLSTQNVELYPTLLRMALDYLSIPVTAVDVEHVFSKGRLCLSYIRNRLSTQTTRALLCISEWSHLDLVHAEDLNATATLLDVEGDEESKDLSLPPESPDPTPAVDNDTPAHTALTNDLVPIATPAIDENLAMLDANVDDPTMAIFNVVANAVSASGPLSQLELLEDYYPYFNSTPLCTVMLRIIGRNSVSELSPYRVLHFIQTILDINYSFLSNNLSAGHMPSSKAWFGINLAPRGGVALMEGPDGEVLDSGNLDSDDSMPSLVDETTSMAGDAGLSMVTKLKSVTVDHVPWEVADDPNQAPCWMRLWGAVDGRENLAKYAQYLVSAFSNLGDGPVIIQGWTFLHLLDFKYDLFGANYVQTFSLDTPVQDLKMDFGIFVVEVLDNWGSELTCIYHIQLYRSPLQ
ncbi:hypothetical protein V8D89_006627 [Ganoderma adspersum]